MDYILDTFATETGGLEYNEIAKYGEYRTTGRIRACGKNLRGRPVGPAI